jgi:hypothetical protein
MNFAGARLCAKRQPQHVRNTGRSRFFQAPTVIHALRLVLRTQSRPGFCFKKIRVSSRLRFTSSWQAVFIRGK